MVEVGASAAAVFTEVRVRKSSPFSLKDSSGKTLSGVLPSHYASVLGAGGFYVHGSLPWHILSDRFTIAPEASYGLAWGPDYSTTNWSATANMATNLLNGNARITAKVGYGGYKVERDSIPAETRHGVKLALEGAFRLSSMLNFLSQLGVTLTPDGPQAVGSMGLQVLLGRRPEPTVELDGSLGRQSLAFAKQLLDGMDRNYSVQTMMVDNETLAGRFQSLSMITHAFIKGESYATLPPVDDELARVLAALDTASNNGMGVGVLIPYRRRVRDFKEVRYMDILKLVKKLVDDIELKQCHKAAEFTESRDLEAATRTLEKCSENLTYVQKLAILLEPVLPPIGKVDVAEIQRKMTCLLKTEGCTGDMDPEKTIPTIQKRIKATSSAPDVKLKDEKPRKTK